MTFQNHSSLNTHYRNNVRIMVTASMLTALALIARIFFSYMLTFGGVGGSRITFAEVFTRIGAILFGPVMGGIISGMVDLLAFFIKPEGPFSPWITATAILSGVLAGLVWKAVSNMRVAKAGFWYLTFLGVVGLTGLINYLTVQNNPDSAWGKLILGLGNKANYITVGLMLTALIGLALCGLMALYGLILIRKKDQRARQVLNDFFKILLTVGISGLVMSTLNTFVLRLLYPELANIPFMIFYVPRIIKELFMIVIQSYMVSFLLSAYKRSRGKT